MSKRCNSLHLFLTKKVVRQRGKPLWNPQIPKTTFGWFFSSYQHPVSCQALVACQVLLLGGRMFLFPESSAGLSQKFSSNPQFSVRIVSPLAGGWGVVNWCFMRLPRIGGWGVDLCKCQFLDAKLCGAVSYFCSFSFTS